MFWEALTAAFLYVACVVIIGFVASAEVALASISRARIRTLLEDGDSSAKLVDKLLSEPSRFLSTLMLGKSAAYVAAGAVILRFSMVSAWSGGVTFLLLFLGWLLLVTVQIVCRAFTLRDSSRVALVLGPYVSILLALLLPLSAFLRWVGRRARNGGEEATSESIFLSEDGLRLLLQVGEGETLIEEGEKEMIAGIFEFGDTTAREVMVPRLDVVAIESDLSITECLPVILNSGHSRIPVYEESIDNIVGLLYAKDLLRCFYENRPETPLSQIWRPAYFVPQSKKLDDLLHEMQHRQIHMAVIVDEYGGTAGIVTIEDMIEEIVGDIMDEYDSEEPWMQTLSTDAYLFNSRIPLDEVSEIIGVNLSEIYDGVDTLGGFIYGQLGRVPVQGEGVNIAEWRFTVLGVNSRRIEYVRAERFMPPEPIASEDVVETGNPATPSQAIVNSAL